MRLQEADLINEHAQTILEKFQDPKEAADFIEVCESVGIEIIIKRGRDKISWRKCPPQVVVDLAKSLFNQFRQRYTLQ